MSKVEYCSELEYWINVIFTILHVVIASLGVKFLGELFDDHFGFAYVTFVHDSLTSFWDEFVIWTF